MHLRKAVMDDVEDIFQIEQDTFSTPWSRESIWNDLEDEERCLYYVIEEAGRVIAYAGAWIVADEGQITNVAVHSDYRRDGNGATILRKLMRELFKRGMEEIFLEVRLSNLAALALYRRLGFTVKGIRKNYYVDPTEDAYVMSVLRHECTL